MASRELSAAPTISDTPADKQLTLVATGRYIGEGFDEPRLDTLFLTMPISWKGTLQQYAGRLHRLFEDKKEVQIYDYVDTHVRMLEKMYHIALRCLVTGIRWKRLAPAMGFSDHLGSAVKQDQYCLHPYLQN